jgi:hypothetical protein
MVAAQKPAFFSMHGLTGYGKTHREGEKCQGMTSKPALSLPKCAVNATK